MPAADQLLSDGRTAFEQSDWAAALDALRRADVASPLDVDDLERAHVAAFWVGESAAAIEFSQRAFALRIAADDTRCAAGLAIDICVAHARANRMSVALGWIRRAERLLEGCEPCSELGRFTALQANIALDLNHDVDAALRFCEETVRIGRACGDADVIASGQGGGRGPRPLPPPPAPPGRWPLPPR